VCWRMPCILLQSCWAVEAGEGGSVYALLSICVGHWMRGVATTCWFMGHFRSYRVPSVCFTRYARLYTNTATVAAAAAAAAAVPIIPPRTLPL
jgi:hypothetical protein